MALVGGGAAVGPRVIVCDAADHQVGPGQQPVLLIPADKQKNRTSHYDTFVCCTGPFDLVKR